VLDRLTSATTSTITDGWTYDADGNQLTETGTTPITFSVSSSSNQLTATTGSLVRSYSYDAAGHVTGYGTNGFTYNNRGRVAATVASSTDYLYNALGQMIEKSGTLGTTLFMQDEVGHLIGEYNGSGGLIEETIWLGDTPVATLQPNGSGGVNVYYVHTDHLNTPRKVAQPTSGTLAWRWDTDPFGTAAPNQNPAGLGTFAYNLRFPGQYYDAETGLNQNWNRDYDPVVGRYVESDPAGLVAGLNTYSYAFSDPVEAIDLAGLSAFKIIKLCAEGYKVIKEVGFKQAVQALRRGEDVLAPSTKQARKVAGSASDAGSPTRDPAHAADYMKHYHPNPRTGGHVFYSVAAALTLSHYVQCSDCVAADLATVGDFFNPLSLPEDAIELYDTVTGP
jgi:RHS repeat-associated protein